MTDPVTIPKRPAGNEPRAIAEILSDFDAILAVFNTGEIEAKHLKNAGIRDILGLTGGGVTRRGALAIATDEAWAGTPGTYAKMPTADEVTVKLETDGLILVSYRALWKLTGASTNAKIAIFLDSTQLKGPVANAAPAGAEGSLGNSGDNWGPVRANSGATATFSASSSESSDSSFVTTGQQASFGAVEIDAAAGTYVVSVQFNPVNGTLNVKERLLRVKTEAY